MNIKIESGANVQITDKPIVNVYGDVVGTKVAGNVAEGQQSSTPPANNQQERDEEQFHFVHPELDEEEAWRIHDAVKRLVKHQKAKEICQYLNDLRKERKVLLPESPGAAYKELVRMGMPTGDGFSEKYFSCCYLK